MTDTHYHRHGDTLFVNLEYPRIEGKPQHVQVGLEDVRAADDIRLTYDFDRDGWRIEQAMVHEWGYDDEDQDPQWTETAFCRAWPFERSEND